MATVRTKLGFKPRGTYRPDFSQCVTIALQTFAVLIGLSITDFFDDTKNHLPAELRSPLFFALMGLELRYIFGSAMHLNYVYVKHGNGPGPGYHSIPFFLKDMVFLVVFGWLAIQIAHSWTFMGFLAWSISFLSAGFVWSVLDAVWHRPSERVTRRKNLWLAWTGLDGGQIVLTIGTLFLVDACPDYSRPIAWGLVVLNALFLIFDFCSLQEIFGETIPQPKS